MTGISPWISRFGDWNGVEAEFLGWRSGSGDELFDGLEDELELLVVIGVFLLEGLDFSAFFEVTDRDLKFATSSSVSWNMKSDGNRPRFR